MLSCRPLVCLTSILLFLPMFGCEEKTELPSLPAPPQIVQPPSPPPSPFKIQLNLNEPLTTKECYARMFTFNDDRPSVLRITSYASPDQETFPSAMIQVPVTADDPAALSGQKFPAQLFVMTQGSENVFHSPAGQPVEVQITEISEGRLSGQITGGSVLNAKDGTTQNVTGSFVAEFKSPQ